MLNEEGPHASVDGVQQGGLGLGGGCEFLDLHSNFEIFERKAPDRGITSSEKAGIEHFIAQRSFFLTRIQRSLC